ncbi:hypothetical protein OGZ32_02900 [Lactococcus lactis]|uniref:hypothetical protein n=1 Tax=Lactococcus lactis TaxID=1358 RepID=UPI000345861D|nr:hypothetical protein [Lactococcus lactis]KST92624.1 hypothetical protein KF134_0123 [Lactococcus lactis subsp. lactis]KST96189.1 hypothetical protein KF146_1481 [Lactococcus lactis subsp. lactis]KSU00138.1 hypothetical protein KF196_0646 [Lactococcus lactis subsp. lactis]KSU08662.1 hypothetical protein Li1_0660 [Lactococcus lactis subsp. lactis]MDG4954280.1 hypothetical protein [Lactococcus lactis]
MKNRRVKKSKIGNWWNSLAEFYEQAQVSPKAMADLLNLNKNNPDFGQFFTIL